MSDIKLLIIGGFPNTNKNIFGGIVRSCQIIEKSSIFDIGTSFLKCQKYCCREH